MIKIIAGKYKRSNLYVPTNKVRPTSIIKRSAIFSIIESYAIKNSIELYKNKIVLDIFAGTGSLGLESISRGASKVFFYENDSKVIKILNQNCKKICKDKQYKIIKKDVMFSSPKIKSLSISLIFIDPPYGKYKIEKLINNLIKNKIINKKTILIVETKFNEILNVNKLITLITKKIYGNTLLSFFKLSR